MPVRKPNGILEKGVEGEDFMFEGIESLYACDDSVFPVSPAGRPSLTLPGQSHLSEGSPRLLRLLYRDALYSFLLAYVVIIG
jgi:hypothetical protein